MKRKEELLALIKEHNEAYRKGKTKISDKEYDKYIEELKKIDPNNEWFSHVEPAIVSTKRKVKLPIPMKSLNKVKKIKEIKAWAKSIGLGKNSCIVIMPKYDGLSLLHNETNNQSYSRGGAENEGMNCTEHIIKANIKNANGRPITKYTFGEFVFTKNMWNKYFKGKVSETGDKYKSPRNTVAGLLNRDEPSEMLKYVTFQRYGIEEDSIEKFDCFVDILEYLGKTYSQSSLYDIVFLKDITADKLMYLYNIWNACAYIDGLVLYANDLEVWKRVGRDKTTGNPKYAMAYKDPNFTPTFETEVEYVNWGITKSGYLKPVVKTKPIDTGDCIMENPTGYNASFIFDNEIGTGAIIQVTRSGGVIPKIVNVLKPASKEVMQSMADEVALCPCCGEPTKWTDGFVDIQCTNPDCKEKKIAEMVFFFETIGAENMGEHTIRKIYDTGCDTLKKLMDICFDDLMMIDSFGEKTANQVLKNIQLARSGIDIITLMHASNCFKNIGQIKAKKILGAMTKEERMLFENGMAHIFKEELKKRPTSLDGEITMQCFIDGIKPFYDFISRNAIPVKPFELTPTSKRYLDMAICFSGVRDKALEAEIEIGGGKIKSGVTMTTTHLIVKDKSDDSSKIRKAKEKNIPILTIQEFKERY